MTLTQPTHVETTLAAEKTPPTRRETLTLPLADGWVKVDAHSGTPLQFTDPRFPGRTYLLDEEINWHSIEHAWGSGYVVATDFSGRWNTPSSTQIDNLSVRSDHAIGENLVVRIERDGGERFVERYRFVNTTDQPLRLTSIGIQAPFADLYPGALDALSRRVHAHIFTGGRWSWVAAQPMSGDGRILGLRVTDGALWGYSVETRNTDTISNARGHLVLHITDRARNADAFGGQPEIEIPVGGEYVLSWELGWYDDMPSFLAATGAPATFDVLSATVGDSIRVLTSRPVRAGDGVTVTRTLEGAVLSAKAAGTYWVQIGDDSRTAVQFHDTVQDTVRKRADYVLAHQRSPERPGLLAHAILPVDTTTRLTQLTNGWSDWSDGSERIGVALMLQHALGRGWVGDDVDSALEGWAEFARQHLIDRTGAPRRGSVHHHAGIRLYDSPWLARFFLLRHAHHGRAEDLELAARLLDRAIELGIDHLLTIGFSGVVLDVADALASSGEGERADALRAVVVASGRHFAQLGANLPGHEVAYEQAIVAPLLSVLIDAHRLTGDPELLRAIEVRLPWLLAFGGPQPHARLRGVAIRHWDGYWFGQRRQWGDVFPHYWSALTAGVLLRLPNDLRSADTDHLADEILRANMANYSADGSATCAFVMPSSVDGVPAHAPDPLANDQDFHLAVWMQLHSEGHTYLP